MNGRKDNAKEQEHVKIYFMNLEELYLQELQSHHFYNMYFKLQLKLESQLRVIMLMSVTSHTAEYYFGIMDEIVDEIGEEYIVQVVTNNEAAVKADG
ncbi:hypothetical protein V6N12_050040 [Hibiscus sabdariffa]|uniref:DUF659 domain-containing protein n=1 Tax=Hibiscus sabdariffa TaxID=183260 RepID=A0ABR2GCE3_9ROSI